MAEPQGQGQGQADNSYYILWMVALCVFIGSIIWWAFSYQLQKAFIAVRFIELTVINFFVDLLPWIPGLGNTVQKMLDEVAGNLNLARIVTPDTLTVNIADTLSTTTGEYLRYPLTLLLVGLAVVVLKTNVSMRLKKKFNMRTLASQEQINWPQIKIATTLDILQEDLDSGPWGMAMTPIQFCKKNKLVKIEFADISGSEFAKVQPVEFNVLLDAARAERAFGAQLGRAWHGIDYLPPHRQAILAMLLARGNRDGKTALALMSQLATSAADGKLDCSGVDETLKKHVQTNRIKEMFSMHAYEFTLFISALQFAREDGVVASADFLWVKPLDRRLWYVLNNVGRQTPAVEVGGIFCHWYYEMALKRPLSAPRIDGAVEALKIALSEIIYVPDEKERELLVKERDAALKEAAARGKEAVASEDTA